MSEYDNQVIAGVHLIEQRGDDARYLQDMGLSASSTSSGQHMSWRKSLQNAAVWSAIDLISGDISRLPVMLHDVVEGQTQRVVYNDLWRTVCKVPNALQNGSKFWRCFAVDLLLWGNAYARIVRDDFGNLLELQPLLPDRTYMETSVQMYRSQLWQENNNWQDVMLDPSEVVHVHWLPDLGFNHWQGLQTWSMARDSWALGLAQEEYLGNFFRSGGRAGGYLQVPLGYSDSARQQFEGDFRQKYASSGEAFRAIVLPEGVSFEEGSFSPRDAMSAEAADGHTKQIARWFGIPSSMLNVDGSVSYNSKSEDAQAYLDRCLAPHLLAISAELTYKLVTGKMRNRWEFRHDTRGITRMNPSQIINSGATAIQNDILTPSEVRELLGLPNENQGNDSAEEPAEPEAIEQLPEGA